MRRRNQFVQGVSRIVDRTVGRRMNGLTAFGEIMEIGGHKARVQFDGSVAKEWVDIYLPGAEPGDRCQLIRPPGQTHWLVVGILKRNQPPIAGPMVSSSGELSPPNGLTAMDNLPGYCGWYWNVPPQKPVAFEIESAEDDSGTNAAITLVTRGSYYLEESSTDRWIRVRSVGPQFQRSAWSDWVSATPTGGVSSAALIHRIDFAYNTSSPALVATVPAGSFIELVELYIDTAFNGTPTLTVGDTDDNDRLLLNTYVDPGTVGVYGHQPSYVYVSSTAVNLYITAGGASAGAGKALLFVR